MNFTTRFATSRDLTQLSELFDGYRVYYKQTSDIKKARSFLSERISKADSTIIVADQQGDLLGFTQLYPIFSSVNARHSLLLNDLFVASRARRQGVAKALMMHASEFAKSEHACWLMLQTEKLNKKAQALYESIGYKRDEDCFYYYQSL